MDSPAAVLVHTAGARDRHARSVKKGDRVVAAQSQAYRQQARRPDGIRVTAHRAFYGHIVLGLGCVLAFVIHVVKVLGVLCGSSPEPGPPGQSNLEQRYVGIIKHSLLEFAAFFPGFPCNQGTVGRVMYVVSRLHCVFGLALKLVASQPQGFNDIFPPSSALLSIVVLGSVTLSPRLQRSVHATKMVAFALRAFEAVGPLLTTLMHTVTVAPSVFWYLESDGWGNIAIALIFPLPFAYEVAIAALGLASVWVTCLLLTLRSQASLLPFSLPWVVLHQALSACIVLATSAVINGLITLPLSNRGPFARLFGTHAQPPRAGVGAVDTEAVTSTTPSVPETPPACTPQAEVDAVFTACHVKLPLIMSAEATLSTKGGDDGNYSLSPAAPPAARDEQPQEHNASHYQAFVGHVRAMATSAPGYHSRCRRMSISLKVRTAHLADMPLTFSEQVQQQMQQELQVRRLHYVVASVSAREGCLELLLDVQHAPWAAADAADGSSGGGGSARPQWLLDLLNELGNESLSEQLTSVVDGDKADPDRSSSTIGVTPASVQASDAGDPYQQDRQQQQQQQQKVLCHVGSVVLQLLTTQGVLAPGSEPRICIQAAAASHASEQRQVVMVWCAEKQQWQPHGSASSAAATTTTASSTQRAGVVSDSAEHYGALSPPELSSKHGHPTASAAEDELVQPVLLTPTILHVHPRVVCPTPTMAGTGCEQRQEQNTFPVCSSSSSFGGAGRCVTLQVACRGVPVEQLPRALVVRCASGVLPLTITSLQTVRTDRHTTADKHVITAASNDADVMGEVHVVEVAVRDVPSRGRLDVQLWGVRVRVHEASSHAAGAGAPEHGDESERYLTSSVVPVVVVDEPELQRELSSSLCAPIMNDSLGAAAGNDDDVDSQDQDARSSREDVICDLASCMELLHKRRQGRARSSDGVGGSSGAASGGKFSQAMLHAMQQLALSSGLLPMFIMCGSPRCCALLLDAAVDAVRALQLIKASATAVSGSIGSGVKQATPHAGDHSGPMAGSLGQEQEEADAPAYVAAYQGLRHACCAVGGGGAGGGGGGGGAGHVLSAGHGGGGMGLLPLHLAVSSRHRATIELVHGWEVRYRHALQACSGNPTSPSSLSSSFPSSSPSSSSRASLAAGYDHAPGSANNANFATNSRTGTSSAGRSSTGTSSTGTSISSNPWEDVTSGISPLHLAAALDDGGRLAAWALVRFGKSRQLAAWSRLKVGTMLTRRQRLTITRRVLLTWLGMQAAAGAQKLFPRSSCCWWWRWSHPAGQGHGPDNGGKDMMCKGTHGCGPVGARHLLALTCDVDAYELQLLPHTQPLLTSHLVLHVLLVCAGTLRMALGLMDHNTIHSMLAALVCYVLPAVWLLWQALYHSRAATLAGGMHSAPAPAHARAIQRRLMAISALRSAGRLALAMGLARSCCGRLGSDASSSGVRCVASGADGANGVLAPAAAGLLLLPGSQSGLQGGVLGSINMLDIMARGVLEPLSMQMHVLRRLPLALLDAASMALYTTHAHTWLNPSLDSAAASAVWRQALLRGGLGACACVATTGVLQALLMARVLSSGVRPGVTSGQSLLMHAAGGAGAGAPGSPLHMHMRMNPEAEAIGKQSEGKVKVA